MRATACTHVVIADGNPDHAFLDISIRLRGGRTAQAKAQATAHIFAAAEEFCAALMSTSSLMLSTWKIAPALAAGCTVVHKPAESSPLTARLLAEICHDAGLPPGVLNLINGWGEEAGKALTEHPDIKAIAFVGETRTGSMIMRQGAETLKRVHFELDGKNPVIVFEDADFERALDAVIFMIYSLNGERCTSSSRLLIQDSIADRFHAALIDRINKIKVGVPLNPDTEIGPLIHKTHFDKVMGYVGIGQAEGATLAAGGTRVGDVGYFIRPTLFTNATPDMCIARNEVFGPFLTSLTFHDETEALRIANDVAFTNGTGPRLHHLALWLPTPLNIIDLLDLIATSGYLTNIERGPGRHGISNAFFLYIRDQDGHRTEIYCSDYQTLDPDPEPIKWDLTDPQRQTLWGAVPQGRGLRWGRCLMGPLWYRVISRRSRLSPLRRKP